MLNPGTCTLPHVTHGVRQARRVPAREGTAWSYLLVSVGTLAGCTTPPDQAPSQSTRPQAQLPQASGKGEEAFQEGISWIRGGRSDLAYRSLTQAINENPTLAKAHLQRGIVAIGLRRFPSAIDDLTVAISLAAEPRGAAYYWRAVAHSMLDSESRVAIEDFDQAITREYAVEDCYYMRGMIHLAREAYDEAIGDFTQALERNPGSYDAHLGRGMTWYQLEVLGLAIEDLDAAVRLRPQAAEPYYHRAMARLGAAKWSAVVEDCERALALSSGPEDYRDEAVELKELALEQQRKAAE